jgi:hypothetical protein
MGESASGRFTYQSSGCVIWTCMHHMRGGMVLGERMSDRRSTIVRRRRRRDIRCSLRGQSGSGRGRRRGAGSRQGADSLQHRYSQRNPWSMV